MKILGVTFLIGLVALFQSCDDSDGYSIGDIAVDYATIHVQGVKTYSFTGDTWGTMWPAVPTYLGFKPVEGQRAFVVFNPLYDDFEGYDVAIKVTDIAPILTKPVEKLTADNEKAYGDDPARITDVWLGGGYLNLIFNQHVPKNGPHRVSLVENTEKQYADDGYVHLEYRYNSYGDTLSNVLIRSTVSYNLNSLSIKDKKGIKLRINSAVNGEKIITLDADQKTLPEDTKDLDFSDSNLK